jgi:YVTN family beta-propeller protein
MRCVRVGADSGIVEQPHNIKLAPDGKHWYVCFSNGSVVQKFDAVGDTLVGQVDITYGKWNVITFTQDSKTAFVSDLSNNGRIAEVDLTTMTLKRMYASGLFSNPHGMAVTLSGDTVYATAQYGNMIYRIIRSIPKVDQISLEKGVAPSLTPNLLDPHEILIHEGKRQYYVTCQASNQVFVMDASADTVIKKIDVGVFPLEMALSPSKNLLFITCQEDPNPVNPFFKGSVYVINLNTLTVTKTIYEKFYQPHGIALDDKRGHLYVASTNGNPTGPAPHHASECAGRNGFFHVIDIQTWKTIRNASEVSVFPYSVAVKE